MLSIANIKSSGAASSYYELDDYYAKDSDEHKGLSTWFGKGAKELGLEGRVEPEAFKAMLEGKLPNGIELGRTQGDAKVHAPGIDLTFSAPKSVSIMALVGGDKRILEVQKDAVTTTLEWVEKNITGTRSMNDGKLNIEAVDNIVAAMFVHDTSRNMDPQLHTHCVLSNVVRREDKEWRSAYFKGIFDNKLFLGQVYRSELAKGMAELGYNIEQTHKDGRFEIKEVPVNLIDAFSSRSKEIREALKDYEFVNAKTAENAALRTRFTKKEADREILYDKWKNIGKELGFDAEKSVKSVIELKNNPIEKAQITADNNNITDYSSNKWESFIRIMGRDRDDKTVDNINNYKWDAGDKSPDNIKSVKYAIAVLGERRSVFERNEISQYALSFGLGKVGIMDIEKAINKLTKEGIILKGKGGITTREALEREKETVSYMVAGKKNTRAIYTEAKADKLLESTALNIGQKGAAKHILTSTDRVIGIQGYAGVGKTYMLGAARELAEKQGYKMKGMAPSASAASTLQQDSGIESDTIHKFLFKYDGVINGRGTLHGRQVMRDELRKTILVLDEGSLASTKQVHGLLKVATLLDIKVVLVGDTKQLGAVEAGKPFAQLQDHKMSVVVMDEIFRQKNKELKEAVLHSLDGNVYKALGKLKGNVIENKDVAATAAQMWLSHKDRDNTLVLAPANETRKAINDNIRSRLKEEGVINPAFEEKFSKLESKQMTQAENSFAANYQKGDVVLFNRAYDKLGIDKRDYLRVKDVDAGDKTVLLTNGRGNIISWKPHEAGGNIEGGVEVFKSDNIDLAVGDKVVWKRNNKALGLINSHNATVKDINDTAITFITQGGKEIKFDKAEQAIKHIDHAYAVTVYSAQGKTSDNVIAVAESNQKNLTTQPTFYVEISRARHEAILIVDDRAEVARQLSSAIGERISAMENQGLIYEGESPFARTEAAIMQLEEDRKAELALNAAVQIEGIITPSLDQIPEDDFYNITDKHANDTAPDGRDLFQEIMEKMEANRDHTIDHSLSFDLSGADNNLDLVTEEIELKDDYLSEHQGIESTAEEKAEFLAKVQGLFANKDDKATEIDISMDDNKIEDKEIEI